MKTRKCTRCGEEKPETAEYFHRDKNNRGGLNTICKDCIRELGRRWRAENPEKARENFRRWYAENSEKVREKNRRWKAENPEKKREADRRWRAENHEKAREQDRRDINTLAPKYIKQLITRKYNIDRSEIGDELINAKRRELIYYRQLTQLKNQQNETK